jgi:hypothetical protein
MNYDPFYNKIKYHFQLPVVAISLTILGYISVINIQAMR